MTACLHSNANTKWISAPGFYHMILWCCKKSNSKTILPVAFFFFSWLLPGLPICGLQCHAFLATAMPSWLTSHCWGPNVSHSAAPLLSSQIWWATAASKKRSMCISHAVTSLPTFPLPVGLGKGWSLPGDWWSTNTGDHSLGWASMCCHNTNTGKWYSQKLH